MTEQWLPYPKQVVFAFFANPANLPPLMPRWQEARIEEITLVPAPRPAGETPSAAPAAGAGTRLRITARIAPGLPVRQSWLALIRDFAWDEHFCDVQLQGPFAYWKHCHSVHAQTRNGVNGTVVRDDVRYTLPLWPLSAPAAGVGTLAMRALFTYRQKEAAHLVAAFAASHGA